MFDPESIRSGDRHWPGWPALVRDIALFVAVAWLAPAWFFVVLAAQSCYWLAWRRAHNTAGLHLARRIDWTAVVVLIVAIFSCTAVASGRAPRAVFDLSTVATVSALCVGALIELEWRRRQQRSDA